MSWMIVRLILSLAFVGGVLWFAARLARKKGLGQVNGLIEVVSRQRMGRASTINVVRIADRVLVVGATEEQVTLLAEMDGEAIDEVLRERQTVVRRLPAAGEDGPPQGPQHAAVARSSGALAGTVFDRRGWGSFVSQMRERTVRRS